MDWPSNCSRAILKRRGETGFPPSLDDYVANTVHIEGLQKALNKWLPKVLNGETKKANLSMNAPEDKAHVAKSSSGESIDRSMLTRMIGDDPVAHKRLLQSFLNSTPEILEEIQDAFSKKDTGELKAQSHKLKSSARSMGANALADTCQALETAATTNQWTEIESLVPKLDGLYRAVEIYVAEQFQA